MPPGVTQDMADLRRFDAKSRAQFADRQHIQAVFTRNDLRPKVLVQVQGVLRCIDNGIGALVHQQHEPHQSGVQVQVGEQHVGVRHLRQSEAGVHRDRGGARSGLRRQKCEHRVRRLEDGRVHRDHVRDPLQRVEQGLVLERRRQKLADARSHRLQQRWRIARTIDGHHLHSRSQLLNALGGLHGLLPRFNTQEHDLWSCRTQEPAQIDRAGVCLQPANDSNAVRFQQSADEPITQLAVRTDNCAS